jgi:hypothetical protein
MNTKAKLGGSALWRPSSLRAMHPAGAGLWTEGLFGGRPQPDSSIVMAIPG